jgi:predicted lipoprotein with Yx(FWY)xxD motif
MSNVIKEGDYLKDRNGTLAQTADGKPPATYDMPVKIGDNNGGHVSGRWINGQFVKDRT